MSNDDVSKTTAEGAADESLRQERDELYNRLLRTAAEFDNYRKRTERERREQAEFAASTLILDLLPLIDDLERALAAPVEAEPGSPLATFRSGIELIHRQFLDVLRRRGVEPLEVAGKDFDPEWHEAISTEPAPGRRDGEITAEIRRGYRMGEKLLRPAMVKVARA